MKKSAKNGRFEASHDATSRMIRPAPTLPPVMLAVCRDPRLRGWDVRVFAECYARLAVGAWGRVPEERVARDLDISERNVQRAIWRLVHYGHLELQRTFPRDPRREWLYRVPAVVAVRAA